MLRIIQNRNSASAKSYYSQADYYLEEQQEICGDWGGKGAARLGLVGAVQKEDFAALCDNLHPRTGQRLTARTDVDRTTGYDFNFHCPKGVSLAYAFTQDKQILEAFRASVRETMGELEVETKTRVRTQRRDEERVTGNLCWAEFIHFTSRPIEGIPDPHLHAHCFATNATFDQEESRWKAVQFRDLKRDAGYYEAAFHARLALRLNELGYATERRGKGWDLAAIPKSVADKFSRRTELIERIAAAQGVLDPVDKGELGAKTREKKCSHHSLSELRGLWRARLAPEELQRIEQDAARPDIHRYIESDLASQALDQAIAHCFERNSVVPRKELLATALRQQVGHVRVEDIHAQLSKKQVIQGEVHGRQFITTQTVLAEERALLEYARRGRGRSSALHANWQIKRRELNAGQQAAVRHVLESRDSVILVLGRAGTGKTRLMQEAVAAIEAGGHQVFTFAPSAEASRGVLRSEGFDNATTVAELLVNPDLQQAVAGQVLWIDEAGMLGTRTLKQVFDIADQKACRVILSGDYKQHASVEHGAAMRLLEQEAGLKPVVVSQNMRQQPLDYRAVVDLIAAGDLATALDRADRLGWIRELDDEHRNGLVAHDYADALEAKESVLVVCPTHAESERLTQAIRDELRSRNRIGYQEHAVHRLVPLHLTEAERRDPHSYQPGDTLIFHQNAPNYRKGERITVADHIPEELLSQAKHFHAYHPVSMPVAERDLIRITVNGKTKDGKHRLNNGAVYQVAAITDQGDVRLNNGWVVDATFGFIAPGYVSTSHASQGRTVDRVLLVEPSATFGAASYQQFYVSTSRARHSMRIYTDDKEALKLAVHSSADRLAATELVNGNVDHAELRRLQAARARILATQQPPHEPSRGYEVVYGR